MLIVKAFDSYSNAKVKMALLSFHWTFLWSPSRILANDPHWPSTDHFLGLSSLPTDAPNWPSTLISYLLSLSHSLLAYASNHNTNRLTILVDGRALTMAIRNGTDQLSSVTCWCHFSATQTHIKRPWWPLGVTHNTNQWCISFLKWCYY